MHPVRSILIAVMALVLARMPAALAEPMHFFARPANGLAVVLLNRDEQPLRMRLDWAALGLPDYLPLEFRDPWRHADLPVTTGSLTLQVPPTAVVMLRETPLRPRG